MLLKYNIGLIYLNYLMGAYQSKYQLEGFMPKSLGYSLDKRCSEWETIPPKNYDYYFSKDRFTYISREHYKNDFVKGYLWGRYKIKNSLDNINEKETEVIQQQDTTNSQNERAF